MCESYVVGTINLKLCGTAHSKIAMGKRPAHSKIAMGKRPTPRQRRGLVNDRTNRRKRDEPGLINKKIG